MELRVAIVAYQGVLADESHALRAVLGRVPGADLETVGERAGIVAGVGGAHLVDTPFAAAQRADVVVVPGGLGSHRHPEIARWILDVRPAWVVASSTGSALLAVSGLLRGRTAATHWLAGPMLERHGVTVSTERVVVDEPFVTCSGLASAFEAAYAVVHRLGGPDLVDQVRAAVAAAPTDEPPACAAPSRYRPRHGRPPGGARTVGAPSRVVEVELEERPIRRR